MEEAILIETNADLEHLAHELLEHPHIAVDTESNGFHAYFERICLIQISTRETDYIVDPLKITDMDALGHVLRSPDTEKIFHAASNDIMGLKRDFQFAVENLFDTSIAAKLLGSRQLGLSTLLEEHLGVSLSKKHQRHNWAKRPLHPPELDYARLDTHYLIRLRDLLGGELGARELMPAARESFSRVCLQETQGKPFRPQDFLNIKGARALDPTGKLILKDLYVHREHEARRRDRAPFRILSNEAMVRLAHLRPHNCEELRQLKGLPKSYSRGGQARYLLELIRKNENSSSI